MRGHASLPTPPPPPTGRVHVPRPAEAIVGAGATAHRSGGRLRSHGPDRPPRGLALVAWLYALWWVVPLAVALRASVDAGGDAARPSGYSLDPFREALSDPSTTSALIHSLALAGATAV